MWLVTEIVFLNQWFLNLLISQFSSMGILWSLAYAVNFCLRLWSGKFKRPSTYFDRAAAFTRLNIALTAPTLTGAMDIVRNPKPINVIASTGFPAISPHKEISTPAFSVSKTKFLRRMIVGKHIFQFDKFNDLHEKNYLSIIKKI